MSDPKHCGQVYHCECGKHVACDPKQAEWLDAPDRPGRWVVFYKDRQWYDLIHIPPGYAGINPNRLWKFVGDAPQPLPREKTVTLTATVYCTDRNPESSLPSWMAKVTTDFDTLWNCNGLPSKSAAIKWVRETYGVEPTVVQDE